MFSDQDDYWLKWKIEITLDYMKRTERDNPGKPVLIFTGLQVVDENLQSMGSLMSLNFPEQDTLSSSSFRVTVQLVVPR